MKMNKENFWKSMRLPVGDTASCKNCVNNNGLTCDIIDSGEIQYGHECMTHRSSRYHHSHRKGEFKDYWGWNG